MGISLKYMIMLLTGLMFISCNFKLVKTENNQTEIVYKNNTISNNTKTVYDYLFGNKFCEIHNIVFLGNEIKETTTYYKNGNAMSYRVHDQRNHLLYYRLYDKLGTSTKYAGCGVLFQDSTNTTTLKTGNQFAITLKLVHPPNCKAVIMIGEYRPEDLKNRDLNQFPIKMYDIIDSKTTYTVSSDKTEQQQYQIYWAIEDTINGDIQKGKFIHHFDFVESKN